jgi:copper transport protein
MIRVESAQQHVRSRNWRRWSAMARQLIVVAAGSAAMLLAASSIAQAHAALVSTEPAASSRLAASPDHVRLVFSEELEPTLAQLSLVSGDGTVTPLVVSGDPHDVYAIIAPIATLPPGAYRIMWRVVSADGHPVEGSFVFWVGGTQAQAPPTPANMNVPSTWGPTVAGAPVVPAMLRGIGLGFLMAFAGLLFCLIRARTHDEPSQPRLASIAAWLAFGAALFLTMHFAAWMTNATPDHRLGGSSTDALLASSIGKVESWRTGLAVLAFWAIALARRSRLSLILATLALIVSGASGHSAAMHPMWAEPARALHLIAGGAWLGALIYLVAYDRKDPGSFAHEALRVSTIALISAIVVTLTGALQGLLFLASPMDIFGSAYGTILLAKIAGLLVLVLFGAYHRYRILPRLVQDERVSGSFTTTITSEIVVMVAIVMLGGLLAYVSPPHPAMPDMPSSQMSVITSRE